MAGATAEPQRAPAVSVTWAARVTQWFGRVPLGGYERQTLALIAKSTLAATASWLVSYNVMDAESPAFAPFSALLIMQVTVYQSVLQALRFVGAVLLGVGVQALLGALVGPSLPTFVLVALAALAIGRWRQLGTQGSQVATAAFFAFSTYVAASSDSERWSGIGQIVVLVLIGCGIGVLVNTLIFPPLRYRSAEHGIRTLAQSLYGLIGDMYPALREGRLERTRTRQWWQRASQLGPIAQQAQSSVHTAWESVLYNPRRLRQRHRKRDSFQDFQALIDALERVCHQVASMARSFDQWSGADDGRGHLDFTRAYGDFMAALVPITGTLTRLSEDHLRDQAQELSELTAQARRHLDRLREIAQDGSVPLNDPDQPYGILMAEATRLMDEFQHTCNVLEHDTDRPRPNPAPPPPT